MKEEYDVEKLYEMAENHKGHWSGEDDLMMKMYQYAFQTTRKYEKYSPISDLIIACMVAGYSGALADFKAKFGIIERKWSFQGFIMNASYYEDEEIINIPEIQKSYDDYNKYMEALK